MRGQTVSRKDSRTVFCELTEIDLEGDYGDIESVRLTCAKCGHTTESFGTSTASIKRCLVLMRKECPRDESNFYSDIEDA